jgi:predicted ribosome quality control (RQC) complex YloA/Tae2 family protein
VILLIVKQIIRIFLRRAARKLKKGMREIEALDYRQDPPRSILIPLDESLDPSANVQKYFKKYGIELEGNVSSHLFRKTLGNRVLKINNYSAESVILLMELPMPLAAYLSLTSR